MRAVVAHSCRSTRKAEVVPGQPRLHAQHRDISFLKTTTRRGLQRRLRLMLFVEALAGRVGTLGSIPPNPASGLKGRPAGEDRSLKPADPPQPSFVAPRRAGRGSVLLPAQLPCEISRALRPLRKPRPPQVSPPMNGWSPSLPHPAEAKRRRRG